MELFLAQCANVVVARIRIGRRKSKGNEGVRGWQVLNTDASNRSEVLPSGGLPVRQEVAKSQSPHAQRAQLTSSA